MKKPFRLAASLLFISALIAIFGGVVFAPMPYLPIAALYFVLMAGITRGWRIVGWVAFFVIALGTIFAISQIWNIGAWWIIAFAVTSGLAFVALFGSLWKSPAPRAV